MPTLNRPALGAGPPWTADAQFSDAALLAAPACAAGKTLVPKRRAAPRKRLLALVCAVVGGAFGTMTLACAQGSPADAYEPSRTQKLLFPKPIKPTGLGPLIGGEKVYLCPTACVITITATLLPTVNGRFACKQSSFALEKVVYLPKEASQVKWQLKWTNSGIEMRFAPFDPVKPSKKYGILIADNRDPADPNKLVWADYSTNDKEVIKNTTEDGATRRIKASAYSGFMQWKLEGEDDSKFEDCEELDPIIMNDGM